MTTKQLAEKLDIVPSTIVMYENGKHPIPYDVAIKLADVLEIEVSLLYDDFSRFLAVPYTEALKSVRTALGLSQKAFAERIDAESSIWYNSLEQSPFIEMYITPTKAKVAVVGSAQKRCSRQS